MTEKIKKLKPYSYSEIAQITTDGGFQCGLSMASLMQFEVFKPDFYKG